MDPSNLWVGKLASGDDGLIRSFARSFVLSLAFTTAIYPGAAAAAARLPILTLARMRIGARRANERKKEVREGGREDGKGEVEGGERGGKRSGASILSSFGGRFGRVIREGASRLVVWRPEEGARERSTGRAQLLPLPLAEGGRPKPQTLCEIAPSKTFPDGVHGDGGERPTGGRMLRRTLRRKRLGRTDRSDIWKGSGCRRCRRRHCRRRVADPRSFSAAF